MGADIGLSGDRSPHLSSDEGLSTTLVSSRNKSLEPTDSHFSSHGPASQRTRLHQHLSPELAGALDGHRIDKWSAATRRVYLAVFVTVLCCGSFGYDSQIISSVIGMPAYHAQFPDVGKSGAFISGVISVYNAGVVIGGPISGWASDRWGRRVTMGAGAAIVCIGTILTSTAASIGQFMAGRVVLGFGAILMLAPAVVYASEIAFPSWRGRCTGMFNCGYFLGSIPGSAVCYGTSFIKGNLSWQIPHIVQIIVPLLILALLPLCPESPRYMLTRGDEDAAMAFLVKYHGNGDPNSRLAHLEFSEMRESLAAESAESSLNYAALFNSRARRWRMAQVLMMAVFSQFTGAAISYFSIVLYTSMGISKTSTQLGYNVLTSGVCGVASFAGAVSSDFVPRRAQLAGGTATMGLVLGAFTGLIATSMNGLARVQAASAPGAPDAQLAGVPSLLQQIAHTGNGAFAMYVIFQAVHSYAYMCLNAIVPTEALSIRMRGRGTAICWIVMMAMQFVAIFGIGIGFERTGWKILIVFIVMDVVGTLCWYLFGVEALGFTLEELDAIYADPHPVAASIRREKLHVTKGHVV